MTCTRLEMESKSDIADAGSLDQRSGFLRGNMLVLTLTQMLGMFGRSMVFPYASLYILALGGEPAQIGWVNSLSPLAGLLVFPIAGYLADLTGRVKLIALAGYLSGLTGLIYVLAPSWQFIAVAGLLQGLMAFQFPPTSALLADSLTPENRGLGIATMNCISGVVAIFSPYLAGAILNRYDVEVGMRAMYGVMMGINLLNATINLRFLQETSANSSHTLRLADLSTMLKEAYAGIPDMLRQLPRSLRALAGVIILGFVANAIAGPFWVVYAIDHIGLSSTQWGLILLIETLLRTALYIPAGLLVDRFGRVQSLIVSLAIALVSLPLFALATGFAHIVLIRCAVAIANVFFTPASTALMADSVSRANRGRVMAAIGRGALLVGAAAGGTGGPGMGFLITVPVMLGSLAGGYLYTWNPAAPWFFVLAAMLASLALSIGFVRAPQQAEL
jgi:DHA1 family tetracycline resistance protein-like MFS transporter